MAARSVRLPERGDDVGRFRVVAEIAQGGMAAVLAVIRTHRGGFGKLYAMKMVLPNLAGERKFIDMLLDEARIAALVRHPNVIDVVDVDEHDGLPYIVMEFLSGQSLGAVLKRARENGGMPPALFLHALAEAARGLHAAHEATGHDEARLGIVHRDVSPQNVHVDYEGRVRIVDFGIASATGRLVITRTHEVKGKLAYMAPEQIHGESAVDRRADLWALGVMAWETLANERLFRDASDASTMYNVLEKRVPELAERAPGLPGAALDVVMACLSRDRLARPSSALEVATALDRAVLELGGGDQAALRGLMKTLFHEEQAEHERWLRQTLAPSKADLGKESRLEEASGTFEASATRDATRPTVEGPRKVEAHASSTPDADEGIDIVEGSLVTREAHAHASPEPRSATPVRRSWLGASAIVLVGLSAGAALIAWPSSPEPAADRTALDSPGSAARADLPRAEGPGPAPLAEVPVTRVTVTLGASVAAVRVDGARHDERTITVPVPAVVQLEARDGALEERVLELADARTVLSMTETSPAATLPPPATPPAAAGSARERTRARSRDEAAPPVAELEVVVAEAPAPAPPPAPPPVAAPPAEEHPRRLPGGMLPL